MLLRINRDIRKSIEFLMKHVISECIRWILHIHLSEVVQLLFLQSDPCLFSEFSDHSLFFSLSMVDFPRRDSVSIGFRFMILSEEQNDLILILEKNADDLKFWSEILRFSNVKHYYKFTED